MMRQNEQKQAKTAQDYALASGRGDKLIGVLDERRDVHGRARRAQRRRRGVHVAHVVQHQAQAVHHRRRRRAQLAARGAASRSRSRRGGRLAQRGRQRAQLSHQRIGAAARRSSRLGHRRLKCRLVTLIGIISVGRRSLGAALGGAAPARRARHANRLLESGRCRHGRGGWAGPAWRRVGRRHQGDRRADQQLQRVGRRRRGGGRSAARRARRRSGSRSSGARALGRRRAHCGRCSGSSGSGSGLHRGVPRCRRHAAALGRQRVRKRRRFGRRVFARCLLTRLRNTITTRQTRFLQLKKRSEGAPLPPRGAGRGG